MRLLAKYQSATGARLKAEAELTAAVFARDPKAGKVARRALKSALAEWRRASEQLQQHERSHAMTAGASPQV